MIDSFCFYNKLLISGASSVEVKTEGVRHGSPMKEVKDGKLNSHEDEKSKDGKSNSQEVEDGKDLKSE